MQLLVFLDGLLQVDELPAGAAAAIEAAYHFSESEDWEILTRWYQVMMLSSPNSDEFLSGAHQR